MRVFLDANVLIQGGKPPGGPLIDRIRDLVTAGLVKIITTDLTIDEVARKHATNDYDAIKEAGSPHFRRLIREHLSVTLPDVTKAELRSSIVAKHKEAARQMLAAMGATILALDDVKPSKVFADYSAGTGFFSGDGKKDQFPDAFIHARLIAEATADDPILIVSSDQDYVGPTTNAQHLTLLDSIPALFTMLGFQVDSPQIDHFLSTQHDEILQRVDKTVNDFGLQVVDVDEAEIFEASVTSVELIDVATFAPIRKDGKILVVGYAEITATASYQHPDWDTATYDSEDGRLIPWHTERGETEVQLVEKFSMAIRMDAQGNPMDIEELEFESDGFDVDLYGSENYE